MDRCLSPLFLEPTLPFTPWVLLPNWHPLQPSVGCEGLPLRALTPILKTLRVHPLVYAAILMAGIGQDAHFFCSLFFPFLYPHLFSLRTVSFPWSFCLRHFVCDRKSQPSEDLGFWDTNPGLLILGLSVSFPPPYLLVSKVSLFHVSKHYN